MREPPFRIGQPVLCVRVDTPDDSPHPKLTLWTIYHVASVRYFTANELMPEGYDSPWGITVDELPVYEDDVWYAEYKAHCFRPIEPDSLVDVDQREEEDA